MPKPTLRGRKPANRELQPELYLNRPKARGFRPSYDEMREALIATRGRYGLASIRLQCAERSLRDWVRQEPSLVELVEELRTLRIDKSEARIDQIADDPTHQRSFDANRLIVERLGRHRGWGAYLEVAGKLQQTVEVSPYVPIDQRSLQPETWEFSSATGMSHAKAALRCRSASDSSIRSEAPKACGVHMPGRRLGALCPDRRNC
jgi:hypothetical protein